MNQSSFITVVSGAPRSGTSMMMQILRSGGMPIATDGARQADENNPHGYLELECVKSLERPGPHLWVRELLGRAVKIPYILLYSLPYGWSYKIIFMDRDWSEIAASQRAMLAHRGITDLFNDADLVATFRTQVIQLKKWLHSQFKWPVMYVDYKEVIQDAARHCRRVNDFVGGDLDVSRMSAAVDTSLYRQRQIQFVEESTIVDERVTWQRLKDLGYL